MENILLENITKLLLSDEIKISLYDVFNDEVIDYEYDGINILAKDKKILSSYLEELKVNIDEAYQKDFMNLISIPKLEEEKKNGNEKVKASYKTLNGEAFLSVAMLINKDEKNAILVITRKENAKNIGDEADNNSKYNGLIELLSDSIIKVQNVFDVDKDSKNVSEYINSVFSNLISNYDDLKTALNKTVANVTGRKEDAILIVDDDIITRNMIKKVFDGQYKMVMATNGKEAIDYLEENANKGFSSSSDHIVGIFLDLTMPVLDGFAVLEYLNKKNILCRIPVIIISGDYEKETKARVYNYNIADMLEKPFDFEIVKHRVRNFVNLYKSSNSLNELVSNQNRDLKDLINPFIDAYMYDYKENIEKVSRYIGILCDEIVKTYPEYGLDELKINKLKEAVRYYDIGFYSIPRTLLNGNTRFNKEELNRIKTYPLFSSKMLDYILNLTSDEGYKTYAKNIARHYHENYDGSGYPGGLKEDEIPLEAQIAAICIMYNNLNKKENINPKNIIASKKGVMFNPKLVDCFLNVYEKIESIN